MFGPLPLIYRIIVSLVSVGFCVGGGAWLAWRTPLPVVVSVGALLGALAGVAASYLLVHDFRDRWGRQPQPAPVRRRH